MVLRFISFIIAASFFVSALQAGGLNEADLIMTHHLPAKSSQHVYSHFVANKAPGVLPYSYHITLGWVKDVASQDRVPLKIQFDKVLSRYKKNLAFTPSEVKMYTVNRLPSKSPLVLAPKLNEEQTFKQINLALYKELQKFNVAKGKKYSFHQDVVPALYTPHITLVKSMDIKNNNLNRGQLIGLINPVVKAQPVELLQDAKPKAPAAKKAKPSKKGKASKPVKAPKKAKPVKKAKSPKKTKNVKAKSKKVAHKKHWK